VSSQRRTEPPLLPLLPLLLILNEDLHLDDLSFLMSVQLNDLLLDDLLLDDLLPDDDLIGPRF